MSKPGEEGSRLGWELVCGGLGGSWRKDGENPEGFDIWESTPTWVDNRSLAEGPLLLTWETWSMVVAPGHSFPVLSFVNFGFLLRRSWALPSSHWSDWDLQRGFLRQSST